MQNEHTSQSFTISINKTTDLKSGDLIKILDMRGDPLEYAYLLKDPVKMNGIFIIDIKTQNGETVAVAVTNAIQKV
jgi:hypothetical protein